MINATQLKEILEDAKGNIPAIAKTYPVISSEGFQKHTRDIKFTPNQVQLIGVLPGFGLEFPDRDNYGHSNRLMFFIVRKQSERESEEEFLKLFDDAAAVLLDFEKWLFKKHDEFPRKSLYKKIDFRSFKADPVENYYGMYGYVCHFDLKNYPK